MMSTMRMARAPFLLTWVAACSDIEVAAALDGGFGVADLPFQVRLVAVNRFQRIGLKPVPFCDLQ